MAILAFIFAEAALFRAGWYTQYLQPDSAAGNVEYHLYWIRHTAPVKQPEVMVVGDSRIAEGFSSIRAATVVGNRMTFWNMGLGGTTPRDWYYLIRDADPDGRRFAAIVLALDHYSDEDSSDDLRGRIGDLTYSIGRLRFSDCWDFALSMNSVEDTRTALVGCFFKGLTLRRDVREFLMNPSERLRRVHDTRAHGLERLNGYPGKPESLRGLSDKQVDTIRLTVTPPVAPDEGRTTQYRQHWLGRILDLYRSSPTHIVFVELPRPRPGRSIVAARFLQSVATRTDVSILPADAFHDFERPELFADGLHLNSEGRTLFSARLAGNIEKILGIH